MRKTFLLVAFAVLAFACNDTVESTIPYVSVSLKLDLNYEDSDLVPQLNAKTFSYKNPRLGTDEMGFGGVLVINGFGPNLDYNLYAYDLACPKELNRDVQLVPSGTKTVNPDKSITYVGGNGTAKCPKCGAVYEIDTGSGLGEETPLQSYSVVKREDRIFYVRN